MESVLKFLEEKDSIWSIDYERYKDFNQVAKKFGYEFQSSRTVSEVELYLLNKIKQILHGEDLNEYEFKKINDHLALKYYTSDNMEYKNAYELICLISSIGRLRSYTECEESWHLARDYLEAFFSLKTYKSNNFLFTDDENKKIAESIIFLRSNGYKVKIISGHPILDKNDELRLLKSLRNNFKHMGYNSIRFTLICISDLYDSGLKRFFFNSEPSITSNIKLDTPWGYLFNLSLGNLHSVKDSRKYKRIFLKCIEISKHYFCIRRLQTFSKYADINLDHNTVLPAIQKNILYDQHYSIDQISDKHIVRIISGIFLSEKLPKINVDINLYIDILKSVTHRSKHDLPLKFNHMDIMHDLKYKYTEINVKTALKSLSFKADEINKDYLKPDEIAKKNYYEKPFAHTDGYYIYVNPIINNYGFYASLANLFKAGGVNGHDMGKAIEDFVGRVFSSSGITFHSNKEYKIPSQVREELSINSIKRECDYIIETSDTIILIELKRKTLTTGARAGNSLKSIIDLSQSFLHALAQTGCHEYLLRRDGFIKFEDGTKIELLNRNIERVALSLFGFFSLQDGHLIHQILNILINAKIESEDKKEDEKVNKNLLELQNQYNTNIFRDTYLKPNITFFNCRFISVPQLMEILSNSSNNEELLIELNHTRQASTGSKDWFSEYKFIRDLKQKK
jgi:hypothetical protein